MLSIATPAVSSACRSSSLGWGSTARVKCGKPDGALSPPFKLARARRTLPSSMKTSSTVPPSPGCWMRLATLPPSTWVKKRSASAGLVVGRATVRMRLTAGMAAILRGGGLPVGRQQRQDEKEIRSHPRPAVQPDTAAHAGHQMLDDGQPQTRACVAGPALVHLVEALEHPRLVLDLDTDTT